MIKGYITNLGKYNEGELIGEWISFPIDEEELEEVYGRIGISDEPDEEGYYYEEIFFTDWETEFAMGFGEYESIDRINEIAEALESADIDIVKAIVEATGCDVMDAIDKVDDAVFYKNQTLLDVAYEIIDECYDLPEIAQRYFDYEAFARDLSYDNYYEVANGVILID